MSTLTSIRAHKRALLSLLGVLAVAAQAAGASTLADTQTKVAAIVAGVRANLNVSEPVGSGVSSRAFDGQEAAQRLLLGIDHSTVEIGQHSATAINGPSIGSNGQSSGNSQKLTQAVVLGRSAS